MDKKVILGVLAGIGVGAFLKNVTKQSDAEKMALFFEATCSAQKGMMSRAIFPGALIEEDEDLWRRWRLLRARAEHGRYSSNAFDSVVFYSKQFHAIIEPSSVWEQDVLTVMLCENKSIRDVVIEREAWSDAQFSAHLEKIRKEAASVWQNHLSAILSAHGVEHDFEELIASLL